MDTKAATAATLYHQTHDASFHLERQRIVQGLVVRTYAVLLEALSPIPVDRFEVFRLEREQSWSAWTGDTFSERLRKARNAFAEEIPA